MTDFAMINPKDFWRALGSRAAACAVVTTVEEGRRLGFLALSVTHLAQNPPTIMLSVSHTTEARSGMLKSGVFAINYLGREQQDVADTFGGRGGLKGDDRFTVGRWSEGTTGAPLLDGAAGTLECTLAETIERFDTTIAIGQIVAFSGGEVEPLIHFRGAYR